jgi:hypothetical protein
VRGVSGLVIPGLKRGTCHSAIHRCGTAALPSVSTKYMDSSGVPEASVPVTSAASEDSAYAAGAIAVPELQPESGSYASTETLPVVASW